MSVFGNEWKIPVGAGGGKLGAAFVSTEMGCTWKESSCLAKRYLEILPWSLAACVTLRKSSWGSLSFCI